MAGRLTEEQIAGFQEIFNLVDVDRGGSISPEELNDLIRLVGMSITKDELDEMVAEIDEDGNGEIDFDEFMAVMSRTVNTDYTPAELRKSFKYFEGDAPPGYVHVKDLTRALRLYGTEPLDEAEAEDLVAVCETDPDHPELINYDKVVRQLEDSG